jgi:hypothetical protein
MKSISLLALLALAPSLTAQSPVLSPVKTTLAYSRYAASSAAADDAAKTNYLIYIVVTKGTIISTTGVCLGSKAFAATLQKVDPPVTIEHDPAVSAGSRDTLVEATSDDVYQVELWQAQNPVCLPSQIAASSRGHLVVISLNSGPASWYEFTDQIIPLKPAANS